MAAMMLNLAAIDRPIADRLERELAEVTRIFERQLASDLSAVNGLCRHVEQYRGKMLRPTLVLLSGLAACGEDHDAPLTHAHRVVAAVVEMIHMATLVHDDVLDEADMRRRGATVNSLWGNEAAVMLGDYLISNSFHLCSTLGDPTINLALGEVTNTLCEGELAQLHHRNDYGLDEATYFEIIRRKTASLIGACCRLGAQLSDADEERCDALRRAGVALGMAFQIQDDLLDLTTPSDELGKTRGSDLVENKQTLITLHAREHGVDVDSLVPTDDVEAVEESTIEDAVAELEAAGSIDYAREAAVDLVEQGKAELRVLETGQARSLLEEIADYLVERTY